ncbi:MAG TPA: mechanosensitive ion channel family protein [Bacteroidetes bacterium]|nr:mechanosensitive ion channel family protein [Bacteroidota bacterium]
MNEDKLNIYLNQAIDFCVSYAPKIIMAAASFYIGFWLIKKIIAIVELSLDKANFSKEVRPFVVSFINIALKVFVVLFAASFLGFETSSIVGILAAASFAVGLALQGSLGNFAAGILVMVFRPYKLGDMVEINGKFGKVEDISIFNTTLSTPGFKTLIIPNGKIIEDTIINFSTKGKVRLELNVTMPYEESFPKVKEVILSTLHNVPYVLEDPAPMVGIESFDSHNVVLAVRPFIKPDNYWEALFETHRAIKTAFHNNGIKVAYSEGVEIGPIGE